jgi:hypothetical protein
MVEREDPEPREALAYVEYVAVHAVFLARHGPLVVLVIPPANN